MHNPVWMMSSAYPGKSLTHLIEAAVRIGLQGVELCVFRRDGMRSDHVATHLAYEDFTHESALNVIRQFNTAGLRFSLGAYENLIGGVEQERLKNQDHLLLLIRIAALLGGDINGITVGTFVGYNHQWDLDAGSFARNLEAYAQVFTPIVKYAEDLGVTVVYENCPMEGWRSAGYINSLNNLPATLAARKLMYQLIPSSAHGEIYDPSHDVWQFVDPVAVIRSSDMMRIKAVHLKATRIRDDAAAVHWGHVYGKQSVDSTLAQAAGVPLPAHDWDRFSYEPMVPGFGGTDSMDWRSFIECLDERGFSGVFSIENEGENSKGTDNDHAIEQGFEAALSFIKPMIWPLTAEAGYQHPGQEDLKEPTCQELPPVKMKNLLG